MHVRWSPNLVNSGARWIAQNYECVTQGCVKTTLPISIWIPHMEMGREKKIFPYGDSPFPNRVCSNLGTNMCA